jgi:hypothetical protein
MTTFDSWHSFRTFSREVARERRYIRTSEAENFLATVAATCGVRARNASAGWITWRAQLGHGWRREEQIDDELPSAFGPARMKPLADRAQEGRVNPKGIPCLYLATMLETAISEVRPWIGSLVSVAQFRTTRPLRIVIAQSITLESRCSSSKNHLRPTVSNTVDTTASLGKITTSSVSKLILNSEDKPATQTASKSGETNPLLEALRWKGANSSQVGVPSELWCADFMNFILGQTGQTGTGSRAARSFLKYGKPLDGHRHLPHRRRGAARD